MANDLVKYETVAQAFKAVHDQIDADIKDLKKGKAAGGMDLPTARTVLFARKTQLQAAGLAVQLLRLQQGFEGVGKKRR